MQACMTIRCCKFNQLFDFLSLFILNIKNEYIYYMYFFTGPRSTVDNVSAIDASLTPDPRVVSLMLAKSHTFVEIDHEIISTAILIPSAEHSRRVVVSYKRKYEHEVLVNCLSKLAQEKVWLGELTIPP